MRGVEIRRYIVMWFKTKLVLSSKLVMKVSSSFWDTLEWSGGRMGQRGTKRSLT